MVRAIDLSGQSFGRLTVRRKAENKGKKTAWECLCSCGAITVVASHHLKAGSITSCGCYSREVSVSVNTTHGLYGTRIHSVWASMLRRCTDPKNKSYGDYGARGITVCDEWIELSTFHRDMGDPPPGMTLDRIDNTKGYFPANCRWAGRIEQNQNRRNTLWIEAFGQRKCAAEWAAIAGISQNTIRRRLERGLPPEQAVS